MPTTKYESDDGEIHAIRLTSAYLAAAGTAPSGGVTSDIIAKVSKSNREFGIRPRGVRLKRTIGTAPNQFQKYSFLAVLTPTAYDSAAFAKDAEITIDGIEWTVASKVPEDH